jgi:hypothetical protein
VLSALTLGVVKNNTKEFKQGLNHSRKKITATSSFKNAKDSVRKWQKMKRLK